MEQTDRIEFNVDQQYENEKGIFKVVSIHRDQMVIRWENGEEIKTEIELQRRIAERREWEKDNRKTETAAGAKPSPKSASTRKSSMFAGFAPTDFKKSAAGTSWRSRNQLGEAVAQKIDTSRFKFNSWAFGHKAEMHVQDIKHRDNEATDYQAKFFVKVDQQAIYYGFRVARPDNTDGGSTDWDAFSEWLAQQENEQMLRTMAAQDNLSVSNLASPSAGTLKASDDGWHTDAGGKRLDMATLTAYISEAHASGPFDFELAATVAKSDAQAYGADIAENIAQLFTRLLPLYQAAVSY